MSRLVSWLLWPLLWIKKHWLLSIIIVLMLIGGGYWYYQRTLAAQPKLTFVKASFGDLTKTLQISGVVDAKQKANMRFAAGGKLVYIGAKEGDMVKKGQTIATIDRRELEKRLQQDLNSYMRERWDWDQLKDDTKDRALPQREIRGVDKAQWDLNDTVLNVEIRDITISNTVLAAPFAGILVSLPSSVTGVNLSAADAFELVDPTTLVFKAGVDESDISSVKIGQLSTINLDAYPDENITTNVKSLALKSSQSSSGTVFLVEFPIETLDPLQRYRLGMNGDVTITLETRENVLKIPLDTTRQRDDKVYVDVKVGENKAEEREIKIGLETDDEVEVTSGLSRDDEVVMPE